ncbi:MAG TPA: 5-oxoprolinase subunit PxpA [Fluviicoccus sp.]|nr:5-oxoprolinase subunit PxpA [Fluviicoccus sp.]
MSRCIDLNADVGEMADDRNVDAELMHWITSCNIACGAHAGSEAQMRRTVQLAKRQGVQIGAHPGYADRENMGRVAQQLEDSALRQLICDQVGLLQRICQEEGAALVHVKTHGALYNQSARDPHMARVIGAAIREISADLVVVGLAGSEHVRAARENGLRVVEEVFADRHYEADGSLTPRTHPQALITDEQEALQQVLGLAKAGRVQTREGGWIDLKADTVCLHGDGPHAVAFARLLKATLAESGISVKSCVGM